MADKLSKDYVFQMFGGSICMYKGTPIYFNSVSEELNVVFYELISQKKRTAKFTLEDFTSPSSRLGMVNIMDSVVWTSRNPIRRYSVGIDRNNFRVAYLPNAPYPGGPDDVMHRIQTRNCPEIGATLLGEFPSFEEAFTKAKEAEGAYAFDRQFAVDYDGGIYYKTRSIGRVKKDATEITEKDLKEKEKYLFILLSKSYEKNH